MIIAFTRRRKRTRFLLRLVFWPPIGVGEVMPEVVALKMGMGMPVAFPPVEEVVQAVGQVISHDGGQVQPNQPVGNFGRRP
ncbi:MAG: hypothetical protein OHK0053_19170 [Microscillaceae bacterium]